MSERWGESWGFLVTPRGRRVEMQRKGQRVRFFDDRGRQVGPEQSNVAPALAYARSLGWGDVDRHRSNRDSGGRYWVWPLVGDRPMAKEGPWGPYSSLERAKTFARIGATEGIHDRAVTTGRDPNAASFEIVRRYRRGDGERLI